MRLRRTLVAIAVVLFSTTSWAAEGLRTAHTGSVKAVDATAHTVTIDQRHPRL